MENEKEDKKGLWINLGCPAFHLEAVKGFFLAELRAYKAYLNMDLEVYGDKKAIQKIKECDEAIAAVSKVTNGETFSKEILRSLRWCTALDDLYKGGEEILYSCMPNVVNGWDKFYTALKEDIRKRREGKDKV